MKNKLIVLILMILNIIRLFAESDKTSLVDSIELYQEDQKLVWQVKGYSPQGFKVLWSTNPYPVYPAEGAGEAYYIEDPYGLEFPLSEIKQEGFYFVRIGEYIDGRIGVYSNQIKIEIKDNIASLLDEYPVESISLENSFNIVRWKVKGFSRSGFKVIWSKSPEPVYPGRETDSVVYVSDPYENSLEIHPFNGSGWYYVRIMEYRDGNQGVYSNQIKVYLGMP